MTGVERSTRPLVSVVMPLFNAAPYVGQACASVLGQSHTHLELLVVDDGSTDGSADIVARIGDRRVRLLSQPHAGAATARNRGIAEARGALLAFLDADDWWAAGKLAVQIRVLDEAPEVGMVFGHAVNVDTRGDGAAAVEARPQAGYSLGTLLARRHVFDRVGLLSADWSVGEFIDWYTRAQDAGVRDVLLPDILLYRRVHHGNLTGRAADARRDYARVVAAAARRRRRLQTGDAEP